MGVASVSFGYNELAYEFDFSRAAGCQEKAAPLAAHGSRGGISKSRSMCYMILPVQLSCYDAETIGEIEQAR
jgi:hypothetical protein